MLSSYDHKEKEAIKQTNDLQMIIDQGSVECSSHNNSVFLIPGLDIIIYVTVQSLTFKWHLFFMQ